MPFSFPLEPYRTFYCPWNKMEHACNYLYKAQGNGNPLQYSCLGNPLDRGAWRATVHGVTKVRHDLMTKPPLPPQGPAMMQLISTPLNEPQLPWPTFSLSSSQVPQSLCFQCQFHPGYSPRFTAQRLLPPTRSPNPSTHLETTPHPRLSVLSSCGFMALTTVTDSYFCLS